MYKWRGSKFRLCHFFKMRNKKPTQENKMSRDQIIADALSAIQAGQAQVLSDSVSAAVDASALEQKSSDGTLSQSDVDAAVAAAVAPLNQQLSDLSAKDALDMQAAVDAKAAGDASVAAIQAQLDSLSAAKSVEDGVIAGLNSSIASIQGALDALHALFPPAPQA
jgi:hypothetical protein